MIFAQSLGTGVFPELWKSSRITPIFKANDKFNVINYRPILILNSMAKLFESFVTSYLSNSFSSVISDYPHGFVQNKSTVTNLAILSHYINRALEHKHIVDVIYMDFAKAFDKVPHLLLIRKLKAYGVHGPILNWLSSYLHRRTQYVDLFGHGSSEFEISSGVPQGFHLGPLLFLIFINDLPNFIKFCKLLLFADDTKIFLEISTSDDLTLLQDDLNSFSNWCEANYMSLNISKCKVVRYSNRRNVINAVYSLQGIQLETSSEIRDLGVVFQSNCKFTTHIRNIGKKALRTLGFINRSLRFIQPSTFKTLYDSLVRSILKYASPIWCPYTKSDIRYLEKIQHRFLRQLAFLNGEPLSRTDHDYSHIQNRFHVQSLERRRSSSDVILLFKILHGEIVCPELLQCINFSIPARNTRYHYLFDTYFYRTLLHDNEVINRICKQGNHVSAHVDFFNMSLHTFVSCVKSLQL